MSLLDANLPAVRAETPSQFQVLTVVSAILLAVSVAWGFVDARLIDGVPVWLKPLKFSLSFVVLFWTMALVETRLSQGWREGWTLRITGWVMAAAFLSEMAYMIYQAARAEASHFNLSTPFHEAMYTVMGVGAVSLIAGVAVMGRVARRDGEAALGPGLREGVWLGFLITFGLTFIVAGYLSNSGGHFVGLHPEGAPTVPLMGWSGVTGDLRPAHFASIHAMQALPLLGLWLDRRGGATAVRGVRIGAAAYAVLTLALFGQALMGIPLIPLG
ncbi:hypothetical protein HKCCSP123_15220 [Rhodobacterales bacterium HKCCSP123]|nr:hypothetical protein [Rhodobacterales bacterium HKCCSP123]